MPKENIQRLIDRIKLRAELVQEVIYEAILDQGVTIMIKTATDNPNRTHGELASFLEKQGGHLVQKGAVAYQYDYCGRFEFTHSTESDVLSFSDSVGALDIEQIDNNYLVYVPYPNLSSALTETEKIGFDKALELVYRPKMTIELENEKTDRLVNLLSSLEDFDDVSDLYTNVLFK
jgi:transcriptional/translational regulatory protein YebC/TACO1